MELSSQNADDDKEVAIARISSGSSMPFCWEPNSSAGAVFSWLESNQINMSGKKGYSKAKARRA
eukprot:11202314-Lingulodinium_polyedra.AAC.1